MIAKKKIFNWIEKFKIGIKYYYSRSYISHTNLVVIDKPRLSKNHDGVIITVCDESNIEIESLRYIYKKDFEDPFIYIKFS